MKNPALVQTALAKGYFKDATLDVIANPGAAAQHVKARDGIVNVELETRRLEQEDILRALGAKRWDVLISAGSSMQMGLAFAGLMVVGAMAMVMYELFSALEKHTTAWAHRGSQGG